jgi:integrase
VVPFSDGSAQLFAAYLKERSGLSRERGALFLSRSRRNTGRPLSIWTWSKVVEGISDRSGVLEFTTHTARLARANWDLHGIATFAGHRNVQTTLLYIHLSGRELAAQLAAGMDQIHAWRLDLLGKTRGETAASFGRGAADANLRIAGSGLSMRQPMIAPRS